jgi:hypothetical protein
LGVLVQKTKYYLIMTITICSSLKFWDEIQEPKKELEKLGHIVYMPIKAEGVDYWEENRTLYLWLITLRKK